MKRINTEFARWKFYGFVEDEVKSKTIELIQWITWDKVLEINKMELVKNENIE